MVSIHVSVGDKTTMPNCLCKECKQSLFDTKSYLIYFANNQSSWFEADGALKSVKLLNFSCIIVFTYVNTSPVPHTHGVWMEKCGRTYMLGNYLVKRERQTTHTSTNIFICFILLHLVQGRYERAWDYCCGLGMTPLSFETVAEQTCFGAMVTSRKNDLSRKSA